MSTEANLPAHILLVEDEPHLAFNLKLNLEMEGYTVVHTANGQQAIDIFFSEGKEFTLVILDVMLPEKTGFEIAEHIRKEDDRTGILMLTAKAADEDRVRGLSTGVDDYMTKPFSLDELLLRVRRMVKRAELLNNLPESREANSMLSCGHLILDRENLILQVDGQKKSLTDLECKILEEFMTQPGKTLSRKYLLEKVWGISASVATRTVDNFIVRLRRFIEEDPSQPRVLISVRGRGYRLLLPNKQGETSGT